LLDKTYKEYKKKVN
jgi:ribosomal protein S21